MKSVCGEGGESKHTEKCEEEVESELEFNFIFLAYSDLVFYSFRA